MAVHVDDILYDSGFIFFGAFLWADSRVNDKVWWDILDNARI